MRAERRGRAIHAGNRFARWCDVSRALDAVVGVRASGRVGFQRGRQPPPRLHAAGPRRAHVEGLAPATTRATVPPISGTSSRQVRGAAFGVPRTVTVVAIMDEGRAEYGASVRRGASAPRPRGGRGSVRRPVPAASTRTSSATAGPGRQAAEDVARRDLGAGVPATRPVTGDLPAFRGWIARIGRNRAIDQPARRTAPPGAAAPAGRLARAGRRGRRRDDRRRGRRHPAGRSR
jgi:hypothetical protein